MKDGKLIVELSKEKINNELLPIGEYNDPREAIVEMFKWIVPHWDWAEKIKVGSVSVNKNTAEYLIGRLRMDTPENDQLVIMNWVNYGFSVKEDLPDWRAQIDFSKIEYKEENVIEIKFEGIDSWNRPVFKSINSKERFGSVYILFEYDDPKEKVLEKIKEEDLLYFGNSFNCEPMGSEAGNIKIVG